jgi:hypothetical protein
LVVRPLGPLYGEHVEDATWSGLKRLYEEYKLADELDLPLPATTEPLALTTLEQIT